MDGLTIYKNGVEIDPAFTLADSLDRAVIISLYTDGRAGDEDPLPGAPHETERRGWWGDAYAAAEGDRIGSRLWLLSREKQTQAALNRAQEYAAEALAWLEQDGLVKAVTVTADNPRSGMLAVGVELKAPDGEPARYRFEQLLEGA